MTSKKKKALEELDYLEDILRVVEERDFVEVVGGQGGDVSVYRVYFDRNGNVNGVFIK